MTPAAATTSEQPEGARLDLLDLSRSLGLGAPADADDVGRNAPLRRTMDRLVHLRMARWLGDDRLGIHPKVPALERHQASRLPEPVQADHHRLLTAHLDGLVARAEGRSVEPPAPARPGPEAPLVESPVAARLHAFALPPSSPASSPDEREPYRSRPLRDAFTRSRFRTPPPASYSRLRPHPRAREPPNPQMHTLAGFPSGNLRVAAPRSRFRSRRAPRRFVVRRTCECVEDSAGVG